MASADQAARGYVTVASMRRSVITVALQSSRDRATVETIPRIDRQFVETQMLADHLGGFGQLWANSVGGADADPTRFHLPPGRGAPARSRG